MKKFTFFSLLVLSISLHSLPLIDITKTFKENIEQGPFFSHELPSRTWAPKDKWHNFLGFKIASRVGVSACPVTASAKGIKLASQLGCDVIVFKTIRSESCAAHSFPNIVYLDLNYQLNYEDIKNTVNVKNNDNKNIWAFANSIGNASFDPITNMHHIAQVQKSLHKGQLLIVSIFGTQTKERTLEQDFVQTARYAIKAGAQIIEANLSCPNLGDNEQPLYLNTQHVHNIICALKKEFPNIPIIIKVGVFTSKKLMKKILTTAAHAGAQGVCGINSVPMQVITKDGNPFFGNNRKINGVSGDPIRTLALNFIKDAHEIIFQEKLNLTLIASGGITQKEHINLFLQVGADIVLSATGIMLNPFLMLNYHKYENNSCKTL